MGDDLSLMRDTRKQTVLTLRMKVLSLKRTANAMLRSDGTLLPYRSLLENESKFLTRSLERRFFKRILLDEFASIFFVMYWFYLKNLNMKFNK